jgi:hypothetical protein
MLLKGPNEMLMIDTIDRAGRWEIDVFGLAGPQAITREHAKTACRNVVAWIGDRFSRELHSSEVRGAYAMDTLKRDRVVDQDGRIGYQFWTNGRQVAVCEFVYKYWATYSFAEVTVSFAGAGGFGGANRAWVIHPPTTKLITLKRN